MISESTGSPSFEFSLRTSLSAVLANSFLIPHFSFRFLSPPSNSEPTTQNFFPSLPHSSSAFPWPAIDPAATTNEGPLDLASPGSAVRSDRPRLSSGGTTQRSALTEGDSRPCPTAAHARYRPRRTSAEAVALT